MLPLYSRRNPTAKGFARTGAEESGIACYFARPSANDRCSEDLSWLNVSLPWAQTLRYGADPNQESAQYGAAAPFGLVHGK